MKLFGIPYKPRQLYSLLGDLVAAAVAIALAHGVRFGSTIDASDLSRIPAAGLFFLCANLITLYVADAYNASLDFRKAAQVVRIWIAVNVALVAQMLVYFIVPDSWWGRGVAGLSSLFFGILLTIWRPLLSRLQPAPFFRLRTLVVGDGEPGHLITEVIRSNPETAAQYELVGAVTYPRFGRRRRNDGPTDDPDLAPPGMPIIGRISQVTETVRAHKIDLVVVCVRGSLSADLGRQLLECKAMGVQIEEMPDLYKRLTGKVPILHMSDTWLIFGPVFAGSGRMPAAAERLADVTLSLIGLCLSAPVILLGALAVKLESPGPAFFLQERVGRNEHPFRIIKLRTMRQDAEAKTGAVWAQQNDPRVTRVGKFLRRTRIDELPQFWNVLRGEMSIVGPRPEREPFISDLKKQIPFYPLRFAVKPGVTGWAQVNYRYGANVEQSAEKLCYELFAVQEMTPLLYGLILLKTVQTMLLRPGS